METTIINPTITPPKYRQMNPLDIISTIKKSLLQTNLKDSEIASLITHYLKTLSFSSQKLTENTQDSILRTIWLLFVRMPSLRYAATMFSSMSLDLIKQGKQTFDDIFEMAVLYERECEGEEVHGFNLQSSKLFDRILEIKGKELEKIVRLPLLETRIMLIVSKLTVHDEDCLKALDELISLCGDDISEFVDLILEKVVCLIKLEKYNDALLILDKVRKDYKDGPVQCTAQWMEIMTLIYKAGDRQKVLSKLEDLKNFFNIHYGGGTQIVHSWFTIGTTLGRYSPFRKECFELLNKAISLHKDWEELILIRAAMHVSRGEIDMAEKDFDEIIKLNPKSASPLYNRAVFYNLIGNSEKALIDVNKAIQLETNQKSKILGNALILRARIIADSEPTQSLNDYSKAALILPDNQEVFYNRGVAYMQIGKFTEALSDFKRAIQLFPKDFQSCINGCLCLLNLKKPEEALEMINMAIKINPYYPNSYFKRAAVFLALGRSQESEDDMIKGFSLASNENNPFRSGVNGIVERLVQGQDI